MLHCLEVNYEVTLEPQSISRRRTFMTGALESISK